MQSGQKNLSAFGDWRGRVFGGFLTVVTITVWMFLLSGLGGCVVSASDYYNRPPPRYYYQQPPPRYYQPRPRYYMTPPPVVHLQWGWGMRWAPDRDHHRNNDNYRGDGRRRDGGHRH